MLKARSIVPNEQPGYKASSKMAHSTLNVKIFSEDVPFLQMPLCMVPGPSSHITSFTS